MEKPFKIMISIIAAVFISLAASGYSYGLSYNTEAGWNVETTGSEIYVTEDLPYLAGFAVKEVASYFSAGNASQIAFKQQQLQKAVIHALEVQVACAILQYVAQLHNTPVRIRKSDLLFPFHYFFEPTRA
jgi:hypothetical protein